MALKLQKSKDETCAKRGRNENERKNGGVQNRVQVFLVSFEVFHS